MFFGFKNARNYIRDISIVIVGIVITFAGSEFIIRVAKQKEVKRVMELIKEEIEDNAASLKYLIGTIEDDGKFFKYLVANENKSVRELSFDTLAASKVVLLDAYRMTIRNDAFELLKSSSLIQYVKNKELLLKINEAYDLMAFSQLQTDGYSGQKSRVSTEVLENVPKEKLNRILQDDNVYEFYEVVLNDSKMWYFIKTRMRFSENNRLSDSWDKLNEIIRMINKEYDFKN